jgi:transcription termination factor Rho
VKREGYAHFSRQMKLLNCARHYEVDMSDSPERQLLESKSRDELVAIANATSVDIPARARKAAIVEALLSTNEKAKTNAASASASSKQSDPPRSNVPSQAKVRRVRIAAEEGASDNPSPEVTGTDSAKSSDKGSRKKPQTDETDESRSADADADAVSEDNKTENGELGQADAGNRRRRRRGRERERDEQWQGEPVECEGILDLRDEGYGFMRTRGALPSNDDVYVAAKQVRMHGLRKGDILKGVSRPAARNEKNPALLRLDQINGSAPEEIFDRPLFEELTAVHPSQLLNLEVKGTKNITARLIDLVAPIGKGQRGLVISPPDCGKTSTIKELAIAIEANHPEICLVVLLIDERPEEITEISSLLKAEVMASAFDRPAEEHVQVAELTLERAKRMVESGTDVVLLVDGLSRLARAYNLSAPGNGRILVEGVDAAALYPPKRFFGAARALSEGGSLTVVATVASDTGWRLDELILEALQGTANTEIFLDRKSADRRLYPSIDVAKCRTRKLDELAGEARAQQGRDLADLLIQIDASSETSKKNALEFLLTDLPKSKNNKDFFSSNKKAKS